MPLLRVSRDRPCPVCGKPDWCLVAADNGAAICARVESPLPKGESGWLHKFTDDWQRPTWRPVERPKPKPVIDWLAKCKEFHRACRSTSLNWLANELGVSFDSLSRLRVGWNERRQAFAFPMREPNGKPCGIRYRAYSGAKFSEKHSREGLFFQPTDLARDYLLIVEGATDAAACMGLGLTSVIGRANCRGNVTQIETLCRRLSPRVAVLIPDSDFVGVQGANQLRLRLERQAISVKTLVLPGKAKDVRVFTQETKNAEWLRDQLGTVTETSRHEASHNDESK